MAPPSGLPISWYYGTGSRCGCPRAMPVWVPPQKNPRSFRSGSVKHNYQDLIPLYRSWKLSPLFLTSSSLHSPTLASLATSLQKTTGIIMPWSLKDKIR
ncbi:MAG: hypothetical protein F6J90_30810 [Moorea sp. SIOASIH]|uniref:hypothetical protein n=1 Tax=Moorena sp. SIOASIH TaxID=2607817 RepID=UPI0013B7153D|nr:hypothetical protein [Moorena sp. SIOASIH]NEO40495.1 hypothetical protein [Moorena sp. SIOASIH]